MLKEHGVEPAPKRGRRTSWSTFLKAHWPWLAATDFTTIEVWTKGGLVILRGDLQRAGIPRVDALGRALHFHSFRKTWQTLGVRYGINQRVAQEVLGHSDANLTAKVYTDVPALSLHTEIAKLPWIDAKPHAPTPAAAILSSPAISAAASPEEVPNTHTGSLKPAYNLENAQIDSQTCGNSRPVSALADLCAKFVQDVNLTEAEGLSHVLTSLVTSLHCDKMAARAGIEPATK